MSLLRHKLFYDYSFIFINVKAALFLFTLARARPRTYTAWNTLQPHRTSLLSSLPFFLSLSRLCLLRDNTIVSVYHIRHRIPVRTRTRCVCRKIISVLLRLLSRTGPPFPSSCLLLRRRAWFCVWSLIYTFSWTPSRQRYQRWTARRPSGRIIVSISATLSRFIGWAYDYTCPAFARGMLAPRPRFKAVDVS